MTTRRPPPAPGTTLCWLSNRFGGSAVTIDEPVPIVLAQPPFWWLSRHRTAKPGRAVGVDAFFALFPPSRDPDDPQIQQKSDTSVFLRRGKTRAQQAFEDLAVGVAWQLGDERERGGTLEVGESLAHVRCELIVGHR